MTESRKTITELFGDPRISTAPTASVKEGLIKAIIKDLIHLEIPVIFQGEHMAQTLYYFSKKEETTVSETVHDGVTIFWQDVKGTKTRPVNSNFIDVMWLKGNDTEANNRIFMRNPLNVNLPCVKDFSNTVAYLDAMKISAPLTRGSSLS